jgi:hypothetical protein
MRRFPAAAAVVLAAGVATIAPAPAWAAPPPNDARAAAQGLGALPATVPGTTVEATLDPDDPGSQCNATKNSVWYSFTAESGRAILVALDAGGDLDATVDVFRRERSQLSNVGCDATNRRGASTLEFDAEAGAPYLIRVGARGNSADARFTLRVAAPDRPASFPGQRLPRGGASATVDRFSNPDDAWAFRLRRGVTYRMNLVTSGRGCAAAELYGPGTGSFDDGTVLSGLRCDDHTAFAPSQSGRYSFLVRAPRASRSRLPYRLRVGRALPDDTAPGLRLADDRRVRGGLQGNELDAVDLYRFTVARPSLLSVRLRTSSDFDLRLYRSSGRRIGCACRFAGSKEIERRVASGRYFAAIRARDGAAGSYVLSRLTRTITRARVLVDGERRRTVDPGVGVTLDLAVRPAVDGRAALVIERFDPLSGWLFHSRHRPAVRAGHGTLAFLPPWVGRWRVSGEYLGTRQAARSNGGTAHVSVREPLED